MHNSRVYRYGLNDDALHLSGWSMQGLICAESGARLGYRVLLSYARPLTQSEMETYGVAFVGITSGE